MEQGEPRSRRENDSVIEELGIDWKLVNDVVAVRANVDGWCSVAEDVRSGTVLEFADDSSH